MIARRVRGIVFDLDGTLIDGYDGIAAGVNAARAAFGLPAMTIDDVRGRVGAGLSHLMADVLGAERAAEGAAIFRRAYDRACLTGSRPVPRLLETLDGLDARGYAMSVASNKPAAYSERILDGLEARRYFVAVEGPETAGALKPDPAMIRACLRAMEVEGPQAVYVGDMVIDAEAADRAGVDVILVAGGSTPADQLAATGRRTVPHLAALLEVLT